MSTPPKKPASLSDVSTNKSVAPAAPVAANVPATAPPGKASSATLTEYPASKAAAPKSVPRSLASKAPKPAAKPMAKAFAQGAKPAKGGKTANAQETAKAAKPERQKKLKLLSEKFKLLKTEFAALDALKTRAAKADLPAKRSALLRAGIQALTAMNDNAFAAALGSLPATKPAAGKGKGKKV